MGHSWGATGEVPDQPIEVGGFPAELRHDGPDTGASHRPPVCGHIGGWSISRTWMPKTTTADSDPIRSCDPEPAVGTVKATFRSLPGRPPATLLCTLEEDPVPVPTEPSARWQPHPGALHPPLAPPLRLLPSHGGPVPADRLARSATPASSPYRPWPIPRSG